MEHNTKTTVKTVLLLATIFILAACSMTPMETGFLAGHVKLGPLLPVAHPDIPEPTPAPEAFAPRAIVIYTEDGTREITRVQIDAEGNYETTLPAGRYLVDINHAGMDVGIDLPKIVNIYPDQVTRLDISIDLGIR